MSQLTKEIEEEYLQGIERERLSGTASESDHGTRSTDSPGRHPSLGGAVCRSRSIHRERRTDSRRYRSIMRIEAGRSRPRGGLWMRLVRALAARLGSSGQYEGLDVAEPLLDWCRRELQPHLPNFSFSFADVHSRAYNPNGRVAAANVRFPYPDAVFDLAIGASLFTHMLADGTENYVKEIARVLRPAGRIYATLFLFDAEAQRAVGAGDTIFEFRHRLGSCLTFDPIVPEEGVACEEQWFLSLLRGAGFRVTAVRRGDWRCRRTYENTQDMIAAVRV
jgi:SAM-dependent methyltransferase